MRGAIRSAQQEGGMPVRGRSASTASGLASTESRKRSGEGPEARWPGLRGLGVSP